MRIFHVLFCCLLLLTSSPAQAATIDAELQPLMAAASAGETFPVIVTFDSPGVVRALAAGAGGKGPQPVVRALQARATGSQGAARELLRKAGRDFTPLWIINALAAHVDADLVQRLAELPGVTEVRLDRTVTQPVVRPAQVEGALWNLEAVGAPELWAQGIDGTGVTVAVLDSGVDLTHPFLQDKWVGGSAGWFNPYAAECAQGVTCTVCEGNSDFPCDDLTGAEIGHGTMVTGVILGQSSDGAITTGVAPGATWAAAKIFRDDGSAETSDIVAALQWVLDPDGNPATADAVADVVNASWGFEDSNHVCLEELRRAVQALRAAGIPVVFAAGNFGPAAESDISPANYPESLAIGAVDANLVLAPFSARGPSACDGSIYPELVAPGVAIHTTFPTAGGIPPHYLESVSGTSFSAPHLSGALALLKQAAPEATPEQLENALKDTALDLGPAGPDNGYGFGLVQAADALKYLQAPPLPAQLVSPESGAVTTPSVTFVWIPGTSPNGLPVTDNLMVSLSPDFSTDLATKGRPGGGMLAGVLLAGMGVSLGRGRYRAAAALLLLSSLFLLSCGGGGGDGGGDADPTVSRMVADLTPGTTYYWKVVTRNSLGETATSEVRSFVVR